MYGTTELIASLDLGTTSARAIIFNAEGRPLAASQKPLTQYFPHDGWVEQMPRKSGRSKRNVC